ncbi:hypothetical protein A6R68_18986 [Neotoma lepida]|uniref:Uncharacterized protein n=1 Tax=Neotoma lepida TaxID=56216 RepID=A0A1A6HKX4_NEOLE|nr:hypothetical protein A6R68_18986 [Neotoma lepida]
MVGQGLCSPGQPSEQNVLQGTTKRWKHGKANLPSWKAERRNKKPTVKHEGLGNPECGSMQLQLRKHDHKTNKKDGLSTEAFIPQTIEQMSKSHTCGLKESETGFMFSDPPGQKVMMRNAADKDKDLLHVDTRKRLSTIDELDELFPSRDSNVFIQNFLESKKEYNSIGVSGFEIRYPEKQQDKKNKKSLIAIPKQQEQEQERPGPHKMALSL